MLLIYSLTLIFLLVHNIFFYLVNFLLYNLCDRPGTFQYDFQDPASALQEGIIFLYDDLIFSLWFICGFVFIILGLIIWYWRDERYTIIKNEIDRTPFFLGEMSNTLLEFIWTIIPGIILICLILPSFSLIYALDDFFGAQVTIKIIGHQWYWSYAYGNLDWFSDSSVFSGEITYPFDSYIIQDVELNLGILRLLEVDNRVLIPLETTIRLFVSSADVLHSWAVPSLGVKTDACPGRLSQMGVFLTRLGVFYGQCSEICGINHAFIPTCVVSV